MREIKFEDISNAVFNLCREVCVSLPDDTLKMLECAREKEVSEYGKNSLDIALENAKKARENNMPVRTRDLLPSLQRWGRKFTFLAILQRQLTTASGALMCRSGKAYFRRLQG